MTQQLFLAPSEKHLEEWILAHGLTVKNDREPFFTLSHFNRVFRKQPVLPSGIADILAFWDGGEISELVIIELKKNVVDCKALAQILRYRRDLEEIFSEVDLKAYPNFTDLDDYTRYMRCVLVGYAFDEDASIAAESADIWMATYRYHSASDSYTFMRHSARNVLKQYVQYAAESDLGKELAQVLSFFRKQAVQP